ncbi:MAG TPA: aldehyde dehydrogenase family protein, partial [Vicinamibacterales bacterium]
MSTPAAEVLQNYVGGKWVPALAQAFVDVHNPAVGSVIAKTPLSTRADLDAAVQAAAKAFPAWRDTPVVQRARTMFKFVYQLEQHFEEIARTVTTEHG